MNNNIGPIEVIIPEQKYMSCKECIYCKNELCAFPGIAAGIYENVCKHPYAPELNILRTKTPEWCPILK